MHSSRSLFFLLTIIQVFGGILDNSVYFSPEEWEALVVNVFDGTTFEGQMMRCLSRLPDFMQRGREILKGERVDPNLIHEARRNYETFKAGLKEIYSRLLEAEKVLPVGASELDNLVISHYYFHRLYTLSLSSAVMLNVVLGAIDVQNTELAVESTSFCLEILALKECAERFRPLGATYMRFALMAAWVGTANPLIRLSAERGLEEDRKVSPGNQERAATKGLDRVYQLLHLQRGWV